MVTRLTEHFTLEELTYSADAIAAGLLNEPPPAVLKDLVRTAEMLEGIRRILGHPITVTSGYRSPALNTLEHGVRDSAHLRGRAADFVCPGFGPPLAVCQAVAPHMRELGIDQLIYEFRRWTHVAWEPEPRLMAFTIDEGGTRFGSFA